MNTLNFKETKFVIFSTSNRDSFKLLPLKPGIYIFRNSEAAESITDEAIELAELKGIKVLWMQLGVQNDQAASRAEKAASETRRKQVRARNEA